MKKILFILLLILYLVLIGCGNVSEEHEDIINDSKNVNNFLEEEKSVEDSKDGPIKSISYKIVEKDEMPIGVAKRYSFQVVINEKVTTEDLKNLSHEIIEQAKNEEKFNAIIIFFYDYEEYIGSGFTLGRVEYAPGGDWGKADTVKTGDYKNMSYKYSLMEKDWDKQLTEEEVKIYRAWKELSKEKDTDRNLRDEDEINKEIGNKFNISKDRVKEIMLKQITWQFDDISE